MSVLVSSVLSRWVARLPLTMLERGGGLVPGMASGTGAASAAYWLSPECALVPWRPRTTLLLGGVWLLGLLVVVLMSELARQQVRMREQHAELSAAMAQVRELADQDVLTGLPNRRAMLTRLAHESARLTRYPQPLTLALLDLDHFKQVNDTYGHAAGDVVLRGFARRVEAELRGVDLLARWGGEEFLLMLPGATAEQTLACLARLQERLRDTPFDEASPGLRVTFSAGVSACLGQGDVDSAIERADQAMYRAKAAGRDRSELA